MIDFKNPTNFNRSKADLEEFILFAQMVSGKKSFVVARLLDQFLALADGPTPFAKVREMIRQGNLLTNMQTASLGQYKRRERLLREVVDLDTDNLTVASLSKLHGVGLKTARFIMLHNFPGQQESAVDTHILKFLGSLGLKVPKTTPVNPKRYHQLGERFKLEADKAGMTLADFDALVWNQYAQRKAG
jgi:thermostable 8-oxoguanine DNA glycosylase